ncbi:MAG: methyltransferase domain-containing protein [Alphaproteobacteria bacterium]|nr:methyltransferase domain-containing protein [Alphaproteobacteria bacterium]
MTGESSPTIFDRGLVEARIAGAKQNAFIDDTAAQLNERLSEIRREFESALDLSPFPFLSNAKERARPGVSFDSGRFDLIVSNLGLHWVNDLPGVLAQIRAALKPDSLFIASLIGGESLRELRECLLEAEISIAGGASPRISPMIDLRTAGNLLRRVGFKLPVADIERVTLLYKDMFALMRDLRSAGQTNALTSRLRHFTPRKIFIEANELYQRRHLTSEGLIPATVDIIYLHGWAP